MQLTELLFQRVQGLGEQGHLALRPGYVALFCASPALRHALVASLYAGPEDGRRLADGTGVTRIGVGITPPAGSDSYRILRELGGERQLLRLELGTPSAKKYQLLTKDSLEIESFLRLECGLPPAELYAQVFVLDQAELPSERNKATAGDGAVDHERVARLKKELEETRSYEEAQDQLFKIAVQHRELEETLASAQKAEEALGALEEKRSKATYTAEQQADLKARIKRLPADTGKRDEELRSIAQTKNRLRDAAARELLPFYKNNLFAGGMAGGVGVDMVALILKRPPLALLGLFGFGAALFAVLQWIASDEEKDLLDVRLRELKEREERVKKAFTEDQAPLRNALLKAKVTDPDELVQLFDDLAEFEAKSQAAKARVAQLRSDPRLHGAEETLAALEAERHALEQRVSAQGFARSLQQIEADIKEALGIVGKSQPKRPALPEAEVPKLLFARAAEVLSTPAETLAQSVAPRLAAYLAALTDKRLVAGRMDVSGQLVLSTAEGRSGAYAALPTALRDLAYLSLRLALLERVAQAKKLPVVIDDAFASLEPPARALLSRMLKALSAKVQVLHRCTELPAQGIADHLVKIP